MLSVSQKQLTSSPTYTGKWNFMLSTATVTSRPWTMWLA